MPKGKQYTKSQKAAYAKRMNANKKKPKSTVKKQNQFRVEYKDRISTIVSNSLAAVTGSHLAGPENSLILIPEAMTNVFSQGSSNGQVDGSNINPRYLNMKVKLNFDLLPSPLTSTNTGPQQYEIYIYHGFITQNLTEQLVTTYLNAESGRTVPAFGTNGPLTNAAWGVLAKKFLFNARLKAEFLSYQKKQDTHVRILSRKRVYGDLNSQFQHTIYPTANNATTRVSPDKHYSFNWTMPKDKQRLSPVFSANTLDGYTLSSMFIPFVMVTMETKVELPEADKLQVESISHFTYTDS
jgi:hypothetical protein